MRGTRDDLVRKVWGHGIIPAHAGNTPSSRQCHPNSWDHPRACGEHLSPVGFDSVEEGIIPAHAGNTKWEHVLPPNSWDHPRACGEHSATLLSAVEALGSSPRMRGTQIREVAHGIDGGIIPAHAGNTSPPDSAPSANRDHPRACGEHCDHTSMERATKGSSPRMRGTLEGSGVWAESFGIIPAHAGNTGQVWFAGTFAEDHPRACGEHRSRCRGS